MLGVVIFIAFWVVIGLTLFVVAMRSGGGLRSASGPSRRGGGALGFGFLVTMLVFAIALPALFLVGNHNNANGQVGGIRLSAAEKRGRMQFAVHCGVCHTLSAASATGKVGPDLDQLQPSEPIVLHTIQNGCVQNAPSGSAEACLGYGTMPSGVVTGRAASDVAKFVAAVAGKE